MAQRARPAPAGLDPDELDALQMLYTTGHDYFAEAAGHYGVEDEKALREIARARWPIRGASFFARHQETLTVDPHRPVPWAVRRWGFPKTKARPG